jgi:hypothetical protein
MRHSTLLTRGIRLSACYAVSLQPYTVILCSFLFVFKKLCLYISPSRDIISIDICLRLHFLLFSSLSHYYSFHLTNFYVEDDNVNTRKTYIRVSVISCLCRDWVRHLVMIWHGICEEEGGGGERRKTRQGLETLKNWTEKGEKRIQHRNVKI